MSRPTASGRRELLALHRRHAGHVRAVLYWLGTDLEALDPAVLRTFQLADRLADLPDRADLGLLAFRVSRGPAAPGRVRGHVVAPRLPAAADALARFLADHAGNALARALFVLSEFTGVTIDALATELHAAADLVVALHAALLELRHAFAADPDVRRHGGPRPVLAASLAPFVDDPAWQARHAALLAPARPDLAALLRRPPAIVGLGAVTIAALLLARPGPRPPLRAVAIQEAPHSVPVPTLRIYPSVPAVPPPAPGPPRRTVRARGHARSDALAAREQLARTRDPGAVIVELEMLGAARKSLATSPNQALAYADQHAREYPSSQLAEQRAEIRVRALCALGRAAEARSEAARRGASSRVQTALTDTCR